MGIFDIFMSDPLKGWPEHIGVKGRLDLKSFLLDATGIGDSAESLRKYGRPDEKQPYRSGRFSYGQSGCYFEIEEKKVCYIAIVLQNDERDKLSPVAVTIVAADSSKLTLTGESMAQEIRDTLGPPASSDYDENEKIDFYHLNSYMLEVEATPADKIKRINLFERV